MSKKLTRKAISQMPVVILCGGLGTRLAEETETKPKPLVEIGGRPILWHIMKHYAHYGFKNFVLCLGYKGGQIRDYFLNYQLSSQDLRVSFGEHPELELLGPRDELEDWTITLADTGNSAMTGSRVKRIEKYIKDEHFMLTYGDGVCDVDIAKLAQFHLEHGKLGTVTGVRPPSRFGELVLDPRQGSEGLVRHFAEKPKGASSLSGFINGGFFVFSKKFFKYLSEADDCVLERKPLERLSRDRQLMMFQHPGFWQCMDTMRDVTLLRDLWNSHEAPWRVWK